MHKQIIRIANTKEDGEEGIVLHASHGEERNCLTEIVFEEHARLRGE